ncbi:MAG: ATP-dependent Clp protease ATP-binding subunit, partial [Eubacterium sp.]|nr:ATP-dependent Clp protease ATP-binding subunit [Eubacterium sp.]
LERALLEASYFGGPLAGTEHILLAVLLESDCAGCRLLYTMEVNIRKMIPALLGAMGVRKEQMQDVLQHFRANGEEKETSTLNHYSRDLTELAEKGRLDPVVGREKEIERIVQILSRRKKNNPCLTGEPGVGKTAIVEGLARRLAEGSVPFSMKGKRLVSLDLSGMVAGTKYRGEFEERIKKVLKEVTEDGNIILFVDELHTIIGAGGAEGALDASNILKPSLARGEIQVIGATTIEEYRKHIEKDAALERRFQPVMIEEPTEETTREILEELRPLYETYHSVTITDEALDAAVSFSSRYINDRFRPDKALDLIDEACSRVQMTGIPGKIRQSVQDEEAERIQKELVAALQTGDLGRAAELRTEQVKNAQSEQRRKQRRKAGSDQREVTEADIAATVSVWTGIPVERIAEKESRRLAKLESILHERVIGQEEAVSAVSRAVRCGRVGLKDPARPIGSFLFLGPTGVGKTELSKALAEAVFGSEDALIRVDMSEFMEKHSVSRLIGSPPGYVGYDEGGQLSEKIRRHPYSVILFDEIEKAHHDVFNILLQVLDDGHITDAQGRKVSFKETIIIMTSNIGASRIIRSGRLGFASENDEKADYEQMKTQVMDELKKNFRPEFLNRIDEIRVFRQLTQKDMKQILDLLLKKVQNRCRSQLGLTLKVTPSAKTLLIRESFDAGYGARPLKRAVRSRIEEPLSEEILSAGA